MQVATAYVGIVADCGCHPACSFFLLLSSSFFSLPQVVGKGGFGKVNAITKIDTNELMALKRMEKYAVLQSSSTLKMVWIERKIMSLTNSPFLCNLQYAFESDKELFLVMPFMQGGDLRFHLKERGTMPVSHCRFYACEMILGLAAMHQCLEIGTMVALADGTATAVEKVTRGMGLVGEDGKMVYAKHDAQVERSERHEAYVMQTAQGEYTVSSNHRLTMRMNRAPTVNLRRAEGGQQEMVVSCWSQDAEGHLLQHEQSWPVSSSEDLSLVKEQEIDLYWDVEQHLQGEEITAEVPLQGSHTELVAQVRSHLLHLRTHNSVLLDGDLFELTAEALHKQWSLLQMDTEHPIVQGRAVPLVDGDSEAVEQGMMKLTCLDENCRALYAPLASDDTVDVCYMMQSRSSSLRHLDAVLGALRLPVEGVAVSELHSSDATSQACVAQLESILSSGARTIVAFGAASRESWTSLAASLPCVSSSSSSTTHGVPSLTLQLSSSRTRHVVTVLFAPSTKEWSRTRSVGRAMAIAAGLSSAEQLEQVDLSCRSLRRECTPLLSFTRQSRRTQFVELEIDGEREEDKRFALANGQLTHNSRIVFRDLKPESVTARGKRMRNLRRFARFAFLLTHALLILFFAPATSSSTPSVTCASLTSVWRAFSRSAITGRPPARRGREGIRVRRSSRTSGMDVRSTVCSRGHPSRRSRVPSQSSR
jgi:hypothetical protein